MGLNHGVWVVYISYFCTTVLSIPLFSDNECQTYTEENKIVVDCSSLGLSEFPEVIYNEVHILNLSNNNFEYLPPELKKYSSLEVLDLSGNHLSAFSEDISSSWQNIQTLNLSNNEFEHWSNYGFNKSLRKLDLSRNKISVIDEDAFKGMTSLFLLDLSENRINNIPAQMFIEANHLNTLILSRNIFYDIPEFQSSSLKKLSLSACQILNVKVNSLVGMTSLLELDLSMNQIESIPDYFASNTLQELILSYNLISNLNDKTFASLPHLAVLSMRGNDFKDVWSTSVFASNPFLREIHVKGNRWMCDGFSIDLLLTYEFLTRDPKKVNDENTLICYSPSNVTLLNWQQAYIKTWHRDANITQNFTWIAVFFGIIIGVLVTSVICRALTKLSTTPDHTVQHTTTMNLNGSVDSSIQGTRVNTVMLRVPIIEDLPPSYDEALLMPRLNASFHSLPDFVDEENEVRTNTFRRSRSIGDLMETRPSSIRRSVRQPNNNHIDDWI